MTLPFRIVPVGDSAVSVEFANEISLEINSLVRGLELSLMERPLQGVLDTLPSYRALLVSYDPLRMGIEDLTGALSGLIGQIRPDRPLPGRQIIVPVCYSREFALDLDVVAEHHGLPVEEVIRLHRSSDYLVFFIGFTPGLPYLGGLPKRLATPRLETPRTRVPAGSVGIGGDQCVMYPVESPGGFRIVGRTPLRLYDPAGDPLVLLRPGDHIRFTPISEKEFEESTTRG